MLTHTRELWNEARGCSVFITGGTGFFGMWLLESFAYINDALGLGMRAVVLSRDPKAFAAKAPHLTSRSDIELIPGDVRSFKFPEGKFAFVVHAATEASVKLNDEAPHEMFDAIVAGTRHVLDFAAQAGVEKFLLTSSGAVYGKQPSSLSHVGEDYMGAPDTVLSGSAYGEGKRVAEHMCCVHARQHGYETKIARCFAFVGPHLPLDTHFAIGNFIRDAMQGGRIQIGGDGTPTRSYLYASDLTIWLWTLLFRGSTGRAYNVGSGEDLSIKQLAKTVSATLGKHSAVRTAQKIDATRPLSRYVPAVGRALSELDLRMHITLEDGIRKTAAWNGWKPADGTS
ncbi:NAD-dependent epimerase/dehydratase family protein [Oleiharenicola lentus]|uniref:NAD-dependent epimerase/dehydratase family protein n=1 Tax=Oleiharenicola lentus TaxID=2508720 RepID=UPI003F6631BD